MAIDAKLGVAPIAWTNDDLPELGCETTLDTCLFEARAAGYSGVESGGKFPKTAAELGPVLRRHELALVSGWYSGTVLKAHLAEEKDRAAGQLALFRELGAVVLVYGETADTVQNRRNVPVANRRHLSDDEMRAYGRKLTAFAEFCADQGVPLSFHHHMGTAVESEDDIRRLMKWTGEAVGLLFDTGHLGFAGADPSEVLREHGSRVNHVHAKDVRGAVLDALDPTRESFLDAVLKGVYTVPGDGVIDFGVVARKLAEIGYRGWFVVEAEQDPAKAPPLEYARIGHAALTRALTDAGYVIRR